MGTTTLNLGPKEVEDRVSAYLGRWGNDRRVEFYDQTGKWAIMCGTGRTGEEGKSASYRLPIEEVSGTFADAVRRAVALDEFYGRPFDETLYNAGGTTSGWVRPLESEGTSLLPITPKELKARGGELGFLLPEYVAQLG
ncbi:MAG: hypothetical protein JW727_00570 [Candidatus Aenigmarchaeota archaeon]|nr:hypothetical protein [Candidatus Aenigmarchaeota archaeon]